MLRLSPKKVVERHFGLDYAAVDVSSQPVCRNKCKVAVAVRARLALERPHLLPEARRIVRAYREFIRRELHLAEIDDTVSSLYDKALQVLNEPVRCLHARMIPLRQQQAQRALHTKRL